MIKCPACGNDMVYCEGKSEYGHYEFYGCSMYPACKRKVKISEAHEYDDGETYERPERTIEEEAEDFQDQLLKEGYSAGDAEYAKHMYEKD